MALTIIDLARWMASNSEAPEGLDATPSTAREDVLQRCLDASRSMVVNHYNVPADQDTWTEDINVAVLREASRLVHGIDAPGGAFGFGEFGAQAPFAAMDPIAKQLLANYYLIRMGRTIEDIEADEEDDD